MKDLKNSDLLGDLLNENPLVRWFKVKECLNRFLDNCSGNKEYNINLARKEFGKMFIDNIPRHEKD